MCGRVISMLLYEGAALDDSGSSTGVSLSGGDRAVCATALGSAAV